MSFQLLLEDWQGSSGPDGGGKIILPAMNGERECSGEWFWASLWWYHEASLTSRSQTSGRFVIVSGSRRGFWRGCRFVIVSGSRRGFWRGCRFAIVSGSRRGFWRGCRFVIVSGSRRGFWRGCRFAIVSGSRRVLSLWLFYLQASVSWTGCKLQLVASRRR